MSLSSATKVGGALAVACVLALTGSVALAAGAATFTFVPPVNPGSATLNALSVASATDAWAVGVQYQSQNTVIATTAMAEAC